MSPFFQLSQGTKQGDPLSPLLFILFLEPLAVAIRAEAGIRGVRAGGREHKLFLYADDILWLCADPYSSAPILLDIIEKFSQVSCYKIRGHAGVQGMPSNSRGWTRVQMDIIRDEISGNKYDYGYE